jgi:hypothetical protein
LLPDLDYAAGNDVFDQARIDSRPPHERLQRLRIEVNGMDALQGASRAATRERRSHHIHDEGSSHGAVS